MPFINGRWIDEEQARMMAMRGVGPMIYGGTFDAPSPMIYGGTTDVPSSMAFQRAAPQGMLAPTSVNPLQAFAEPSFTQPLAALNRQATGGEMDPAAINAGMRPQAPQMEVPIPQVPQVQAPQIQAAIPETPQMLPPVDIPSNVSPIDPTAGLAATDPNLQGVTPFSTASIAPQVPSLTPFAEMDPATINAAMAPRTSALNPFARQASLTPTVGGYDRGPDAGWGLTQPTYGSTGTTTIEGGIPSDDEQFGDDDFTRTAAQINAVMRQASLPGRTPQRQVYDKGPQDESAIDLPSAIDLGLHMIPTDPTSEKPTGTDYDVTKGLEDHLDDTSRIGDIALDIANTVRDGDTWGPNDIKDLGLSDHDQRVVNSLIGHVDLGDMGEYSYGNTSPTTSVTDLPGMGFAPGVTIEEQSTFQPNTYAFDPTKDHIEQPDEGIRVAPTHTLGSKFLDELVDTITVPTKTTLSWVDTPKPTTTKRTKAVTRQEANRIRQEAKKAAAQAKLARQKVAARAKKARAKLDSARAAAVSAAAASAAQANIAIAQAKAVIARAKSSDKGGPSQAEINAAIDVMSGVDTFGGGSLGSGTYGGFDTQGGQTGSSGMGVGWT